MAEFQFVTRAEPGHARACNHLCLQVPDLEHLQQTTILISKLITERRCVINGKKNKERIGIRVYAHTVRNSIWQKTGI